MTFDAYDNYSFRNKNSFCKKLKFSKDEENFYVPVVNKMFVTLSLYLVSQTGVQALFEQTNHYTVEMLMQVMSQNTLQDRATRLQDTTIPYAYTCLLLYLLNCTKFFLVFSEKIN